MCLDGALILFAEALKLRKVATTSTAIVRKDKTFVDVVKKLVSYAGAFLLLYKVSFSDAKWRIMLGTRCPQGCFWCEVARRKFVISGWWSLIEEWAVWSFCWEGWEKRWERERTWDTAFSQPCALRAIGRKHDVYGWSCGLHHQDLPVQCCVVLSWWSSG